MATENFYQKKIRLLEAEIVALKSVQPSATESGVGSFDLTESTTKAVFMPTGYINIPAIGLICGVRAYHQLGGWKGMAPELPYQLGTPDGTTWVAHPDMANRIIKIEAKRHVHRQDLPSEVETYHIEMDAMEEVFIRGKKVVTYSVDGVLTVAKVVQATPREILKAKGLNPMDYFVTRDGEEMSVFDDLDQPITIGQGDRFFTESLSEVDTVSDDDPETVLAKEEEADRYKLWVKRNQRRKERAA